MAKEKYYPRKTGGNLYQWKPLPPKLRKRLHPTVVRSTPVTPETPEEACSVTYVEEDYVICDYVV